MSTDTPTPVAVPMLGQRIANYRVVRQLGAGGMGAVYEVIDDQIGRRAALKVLHPHLTLDAQLGARFFQEARAANVVSHPGIVGVLAYGHTESGAAYLVMEYLEGESLGGRLQRLGALPAQEVARLARQIASALAAAHDKGIVHRDLKPDNVMIIPDPEAPAGERVKILDFGIAKVAEEHQTAQKVQTATGMLLGTPAYMAPEQCRGASGVTDRADVYAMGAMLYESLAGKLPFDAQNLTAMLLKQLQEEPAPLPAELGELGRLTHAMMAKQPEQRPSMREVEQRLAQLNRDNQGLSQNALAVGPGLGDSHPSTLRQAVGQVVTPPPAVATPAPVVPTPALVTPTPAPALTTPAPAVPTPVPAVPTPAPAVISPERAALRRWQIGSVGLALTLMLAAGLAIGLRYANVQTPPGPPVALLPPPGRPFVTPPPDPLVPPQSEDDDDDKVEKPSSSKPLTDTQLCQQTCNKLKGCGVPIDRNCKAGCTSSKPLLACLRAGPAECNAMSNCVLSAACGGMGPSGNKSCYAAASCEGLCTAANLGTACLCSCISRLSPRLALRLLINNQCATTRCPSECSISGQACLACFGQRCASQNAQCASH